MRSMLVLVAAAFVSSLALSGPAEASPSVRYGLQDDAWIAYGPGTLDERLDTLDAMGVKLVRYTLNWSQIEQRRGDYRWSQSDAILRGLYDRGMVPVVTLWGTPRWANGGRSANRVPRSKWWFAGFARSAADRYPFVKHWLIWNEPNQVRWLRPASARVYTQTLLNPTYAAIHRATPGAKVGGGVTAPRGSTGGISPVAFIRGMDAARARLDAYAHNPLPAAPARDAHVGRLRPLRDDHDGDDRPARPRGRPGVRPEADLADRVRLSDQPTRPLPRRLAGAASAPSRGRGAPGLRDTVRRHADPVPVQGRARRRALAERPRHLGRQREDVAPGRRAAARAGVAPRPPDCRLGAGPSRGRSPALRPAAVPERRLAAVGGVSTTTARGFLQRTIRAGKGSKLRIWYPRDGITSPLLQIR